MGKTEGLSGKLAGGGGVDVERGVSVKPENRSGARRRNGAFDGGAHRGRFARAGHVDAEATRLAKHGNGQRERMTRHSVERGKTTVVNLLLAARMIQLDDLYELRVCEIRDGRIVECDVAVFADAHANQINRFFAQQHRVARRDGRRIWFLGWERMKTSHADVLKQMLVKVMPKTLRMLAAQADIIVHVKCGDARPIQRDSAVRGINERREKFILRRRTRKDDARLALTRNHAVQVRGYGAGRGAPQSGAVGVNFKRQTTGGGIMRSNDGHEEKLKRWQRDAERGSRRRGPKLMCSGGRKSKPIGDVAHPDIRRERRAREILRARLARDAVAPDINLVRPNRVTTRRRTGASHRVSREEHAASRLGADEIFEHRLGQMNLVGNKTSDQFVAREEPLDDVVVAMQLQRTTIAEVRAKTCARPNGGVDMRVVGLGVTKRNVHALTRNRRDKFGAARPLGCERDQTQTTVGGGLQALKISQRRRAHRAGRMRSAVARFGTEPRAFEMITQNRRASRGRSGTKFFKRRKSPTERIHLIGDERSKNPRGAVTPKRGDRVFELRAREIVTLEINAAEAVDLKIKKTGGAHLMRLSSSGLHASE